MEARGHPLSETEPWQPSDGILFSVFSSVLLWSLIVVGVHATLT
jgi:hypothetical protein